MRAGGGIVWGETTTYHSSPTPCPPSPCTLRYRYYSLSVPNNTLDVIFDLTPFSGDADLYVSCSNNFTGDDTGTPSRTVGHYTWSAMQWGEDAISIPHTATNSCVSQDPSGRGGTFYLAVFGFSNSSYSILGSVDDGMWGLQLDCALR